MASSWNRQLLPLPPGMGYRRLLEQHEEGDGEDEEQDDAEEQARVVQRALEKLNSHHTFLSQMEAHFAHCGGEPEPRYIFQLQVQLNDIKREAKDVADAVTELARMVNLYADDA